MAAGRRRKRPAPLIGSLGTTSPPNWLREEVETDGRKIKDGDADSSPTCNTEHDKVVPISFLFILCGSVCVIHFSPQTEEGEATDSPPRTTDYIISSLILFFPFA